MYKICYLVQYHITVVFKLNFLNKTFQLVTLMSRRNKFSGSPIATCSVHVCMSASVQPKFVLKEATLWVICCNITDFSIQEISSNIRWEVG